MTNQSTSFSEIEKRKLNFRCRRGTRELEELVRGYLDHHYFESSKQKKSIFNWLLDLEDDQLWDWIYLKGNEKEKSVAVDDRVNKAIDSYIEFFTVQL